MALKFEVDLNNLENYNHELDGLLKTLHGNIQEMKSLIAQMHDYWGGDAAVAYIDLMNRRLKKASRAYKSLLSLKNSVTEQINSVKEVDNVFEVLVYELIHW